MATSAGSEYLLQIKAAKTWGFLPTSIILGEQKRGQPGKWDLLLGYAEQILESERCPQCHQPRYVCQNDDSDIDFRVYDEVCNAVRKKAQYEKRKGDKDREGVVVGIESYTHSDTPLEEFRTPFYQEKSTEREKRDKLRPRRPRDRPLQTPQASE